MKRLKHLATAAALVALGGAAQAALINQNDGTVLDDSTNLLWLQDWNTSGQEYWSTQKAWAESLNFAGGEDWRLPDIGEYNALRTLYGRLDWSPLPFLDVQFVGYWSSTLVDSTSARFFLNPAPAGTVFQADGLSNQYSSKLYAVAVRPYSAAVPEPQTLALVLLALGAAVAARQSRSA